ncbi:MAG TPA: hypothetical protein VF732_08955 [Nitrospira sp.]
MSNTNTQKHIQENIQRVVAGATALGILGVGLNIVVMQTLGSFDAASVMLALFLGFWAFVLGSTILLFSSIWLFIREKVMASDPTKAKPQANAMELPAVGHRRMCPMH